MLVAPVPAAVLMARVPVVPVMLVAPVPAVPPAAVLMARVPVVHSTAVLVAERAAAVADPQASAEVG